MFGNLLRNNLFMTNIFEGKINGRKDRGRSRTTHMEEIIKQADCSFYVEI